ncbi:MAG: protein-L-isoaspartate(D-aspartate) O-methyltransferase [Candidatus Krumholzibacteria bacterium]|nr:protein-L-isoaspartate(D-aspartate) O-methyltransferase [Candidatus Krumholzibacteria bacterium]
MRIARCFVLWLLVSVAWGLGAPTDASAADRPAPRTLARQAERNRMLDVIRRYGMTDETVLRAMAVVPRHEFVPPAQARSAYADTPLPIGHGQTISQPYIVAEMTRLLRLTPQSHVLEIGTGSGYQAAILAEFTEHVYTVEIIEELAAEADQRLQRLGYDRVSVLHGDGWEGWPEHAPYDAIIVTCAAGQIPPSLLQQLKPGGRMVIPVGPRYAVQSLMLIEKDLDERVSSRSVMAVRFVPFVSERTGADR